MITGKVKVIREIFLLMLLLLPLAAYGGRFEFIFDNDSVFDNCPEIQDNNGLDDAFDLEHLHMEFDEGRITIIGNSTCVWKGIEPTDRIEVSVL